MAAVQRWRDCEEIAHIQGQRSPRKTVGTGAAAAWHWSDFEEIPNVQGQRISSNKMIGGVKLHLKSTLIPARDAQRAQTNLCAPEPRNTTETETELCFSVSCGGKGQQWTIAGAGALGDADLGMA